MKRKDYQKPTMRVVKLQHKCHILNFSANRTDYGKANDGVDEKEVNKTTGEWEWN